MPFTAEYKTTEGMTIMRSSLHTKIELWVHDSHGRELYASGDGSLSTSGNFTVDDPVAGRMIFWDAFHPEAKVLEYAKPVPGRESCWQVAPEDMSMTREKPQLAPVRCQPAGQLQHIHTACRNEVDDAPLTLSWPPAPATYQDCVTKLSEGVASDNLEKKDEDLGTDTIQGFEAHGCRSTKTSDGTFISELWVIKFGDEKQAAKFGVRQIYDQVPYSVKPFPVPIDRRRTTELSRMDLAEPDPSVFEPPKDYTLKTAVMHEVPCNELFTQ
jgi:hypothetical protein